MSYFIKVIQFCISILLLFSSCDDEGNSLCVVEGRLSEVINSKNQNNITKLEINGVIKGDDWFTLFEMAKRGKLSEIDMYNAKIEADPNFNFRSADCIPIDAFYGCTNLKHVIFPKTLKGIGLNAFGSCIYEA